MGRRGFLLGLGDCCSCCYRHKYENADNYLQPLNIFQPRTQTSLQELLQQSASAREETWTRLGTLEPLVLSHIASPLALGGPKWPAGKQAFRVIRRPNGNVIIASDGLSDPFDDITLGDGNVNGFGLEFFIETPAEELPESVLDIKKTWQFQLLFTVSQLAAGHGSIRSIMDDMKLLSTEAEGVNEAIPEAHHTLHVNAAGRVGALLGLKAGATSIPEDGSASGASVPDKIEGMPLTDVILVNIKLLTLPELKLITDRGAEGRRKLSELFTGASRQLSSLTRPTPIS